MIASNSYCCSKLSIELLWQAMNAFEELINHAGEIEAKIGYVFADRHLLAIAFVHRSYINEHRDVISQHNERLEFLGDSILGLIVSEYLYRLFPQTPEGELSYLRSRLVEASSCVAYLQKLGVEQYILLGKGERMNDGRGRETILSDLFEAIIGAVYLDGGLEAAKQFLFSNFDTEIESILRKPAHNWKALLQDYCQKQFQQAPTYVVISQEGPEHSKTFTISVKINDRELGVGHGQSKKEAQQAAAEDALTRTKLLKEKE